MDLCKSRVVPVHHHKFFEELPKEVKTSCFSGDKELIPLYVSDDEIIPGALDGGDYIVVETLEQSETLPEIPGKCAVQCIDKPPCNTIVSIQGDNKLGLAELDEFILSNSSVDQSTPTEQITCPNLTVLQPFQVDNELDYQNYDNLDDFHLVDDLFYDSDRDPEYVPSSESDSSAINGTLQQDLPNVQSDENPRHSATSMLPPVCTPPSHPTSHNHSATQSTLSSVQSQVITHPSVAACVCLFSVVTNKSLDMFSSESECEDLDNKPSANKQFFVNLLSEHVVFEKSRIPKVVEEKKRAWDIIAEEYSRGTGKQFNIAQLNKLLINMRSHIKKKSDLKETGNKPIKLKDWEKDLLLLLS
ncbi:hypothetical protein J6590_084496 [Homalodisca vitripennis]|nr:hypothetical protein J6590_084496 [Homalodisca vitripennis]